MKILVVSPPTHFRSRGAAQHDIYGWLSILKNLGHEVALATLDNPAQDKMAFAKIRDELAIKVMAWRPAAGLSVWLSDAVRCPPLLDRSAHGFWQLARSAEFVELMKNFEPAAVISFCSYSWPVLEWAKKNGRRGVFRSHNFEASFFWESLSPAGHLNPLNWLRYWAKYSGEKKAVRAAAAVATLPFAEARLYRQWANERLEESKPEKKIVEVTLAFLPRLLRPPRKAREFRPLELFYLGASYNIIFHRRGVEVLLKKIVPRVRAAAPGEFRFHICGAKLPIELERDCAAPDCVYEGYVGDLDNFLTKMDAGVFPVFTGQTMKGKIFESLARAFPVVIPSIGRGGYSLMHDKEALLADSADEFAAQILRLRLPALREKLSRGAAAFAARELSAERVMSGIKAVLGQN